MTDFCKDSALIELSNKVVELEKKLAEYDDYLAVLKVTTYEAENGDMFIGFPVDVGYGTYKVVVYND